MMRKLDMISGLLQEIFFCRRHVEPRVKLHVLREESFPIPDEVHRIHNLMS